MDKTEIVIVKRRAADDGAATKSGAWKIAYADFVTAMMAFFLVMWLINASNEETRSQVASYFNPIKLTDSSTGTRSLKDTKAAHSSQTSPASDAEGTPPSKKDMREEAEILADPPKSLDRVEGGKDKIIASEAEPSTSSEATPSSVKDKSNPGVGDPFDPHAWEKAKIGLNGTHDSIVTHISEGIPETDQKQSGVKPGSGADALIRDASTLKQTIGKFLDETPSKLSHMLEVSTTSTGLLISLTESAGYEMFKMGSAEPRPQMLRLVEAVAMALRSRKGDIVIRGHTDSRPYRNSYYDNWQLSSARANFARYMLIRGGLDESRVRRVEGVADLEPKNPKDPQAPENRRIEIFIASETH